MGSTLVLVNGKRLGTFAAGIFGLEGVNLSAIPSQPLTGSRILTDGASAIYGSDAIAGVINYIMRKDFTGADAMVNTVRRPEAGAANSGFCREHWAGRSEEDKYNAFVSIQYQQQKSLDQRS